MSSYRHDQGPQKRPPFIFGMPWLLMLFLFTAVPRTALAKAQMITDINPHVVPHWISTSPPASVNGKLIFIGDDRIHGAELWISDGSAKGTFLLKELFVHPEGSQIRQLTRVGSQIFFTSFDDLWTTDGTAGGTRYIRNFSNGYYLNTPKNLTAMNDKLYFSAIDEEHGEELWVSDGTLEGTRMLKDLNPGPSASYISNLIAVGDLLFFKGSNAASGLWVSDGTADGTQLLANLNLEGESNYFAAADNRLFFSANNNASGDELWVSDGTVIGTKQVKDIYVGTEGSGPRWLQAAGSLVYFSADDGSSGPELWVSDGTEAGTLRVKDIEPGSNGSNPRPLAYNNGVLVFSAQTQSGGVQLWRSDGTEAGTFTLADVSATLEPVVSLNSQVYFSAEKTPYGNELWVSDGSIGGTHLVKDLQPGPIGSSPIQLTEFNGQLAFFGYTTDYGTELHLSDGTSDGTRLIKDIYPNRRDADPDHFITFKDRLLFSAYHPAYGREIWSSDGTASGTWLLKDIFPGEQSGFVNHQWGIAEGLLFFWADDGVHGPNLWASDGTPEGTHLVKEIQSKDYYYSLGALNSVHGRIYFSANDGIHGSELWTSDGTAVGTVMIKDLTENKYSSNPQHFTPLGTNILFSTNGYSTSKDALWITDGTEAGTRMIADLAPESGSVSYGTMQAVGSDKALFTLRTDIGHHFWVTDGTAENTLQIPDLNASSWINWASFGEEVYFMAQGKTSVAELWKTDGTLAGTRLVKDLIRPDVYGHTFMVTAGSSLYIGTRAQYPFYDLWVSNGSPEGTRFVKRVEFFTAAGIPALNQLVFQEKDLARGQELWVSNGTDWGTQLIEDIEPGPAGSYPASFHVIGNSLFFTADAHGFGRELWITPIDALKSVPPPPPPPVIPPTIQEPPHLTAAVGLALSWEMKVDGTRPLTLSATPLPKGLTFENGLLQGIPEESGSFSIALSAQNAAGDDAETLTLVIYPAFDHDGDGFPNEFEEAFGSNANDPDSLPGAPLQGTPILLAITKLTLQINFKKPGRDVVIIRGRLLGAPEAANPENKLMIFAGGWADTLSVDGRNLFSKNAKAGKVRVKKGLPETLLFSIKVKRQDLGAHFVDEGLLNENNAAPGKRVEIAVWMYWKNELYEARPVAAYKSKLGKKGIATTKTAR